MQALLSRLDMTIDDKSDDIKEALSLSLEKITLVVDSVSNFILEIKEKV